MTKATTDLCVVTDIIQRLRGRYTVQVNDGAGTLDGKDTYTREFPAVPIQLEAAKIIEQQHELLLRCIRFVEADAEMMAAITRFAPLPAEQQMQHDTQESASEVLLRDLAKYLGNARSSSTDGEENSNNAATSV